MIYNFQFNGDDLICCFCQNMVKPRHDRYAFYGENKCNTCNVLYYYFRENRERGHALEFYCNDLIRVICDIEFNETTIMQPDKQINKLSFINDFTPQNINDKLKTILTFS